MSCGAHLTDFITFNVNHNRIIHIGFMNFFFIKIITKSVFSKCLDDILVCYLLGIPFSGPIICFY